MNLNKYNLRVGPGSRDFEFFSEGPKGRIKKIIQFNKLDHEEDVYALSFGDFREADQKIDDHSVSDNKDPERILMTIAFATKIFLDEFPIALVFAEGSTPSRTRYYIIKISKYHQVITQWFEIWGTLNGIEWERYRKNIFYKALVVRRK